jgi:GAF domain-containing protein
VVGIGRIGRRATDTKKDTSTAYGLASGEPVISPDLAREKRSKVARFVTDHGVKVLVNVLVRGADRKPPFGILEVDSRQLGRFTAADTDFLRTCANLLAGVLERVRVLRTRRSDPQPDTRSD